MSSGTTLAAVKASNSYPVPNWPAIIRCRISPITMDIPQPIITMSVDDAILFVRLVEFSDSMVVDIIQLIFVVDFDIVYHLLL